jgi:hypothetical protein
MSSGITAKNCHSAANAIVLNKRGDGVVCFGGFVGETLAGSIMTDCYSTNPVRFERENGDGPVYIGGFLGLFNTQTVGLTLARCYATGAVTVTSASRVWAGGLIGGIFRQSGTSTNTVTQCYATGAVSVLINAIPGVNDGANNVIGGLIGRAEQTNVTECYATGAVNGRRTNGEGITCGGLVGGFSAGNVENCYALGDVLADNTGTGVGSQYGTNGTNAGGLAGSYRADWLSGKSLNHSFAAGTVIAQMTQLTSAGNVRISVGGLVGGGYYINHCAALGPSVTVKGGDTAPASVNVSRISIEGTSSDTTDNYVRSDMLLQKGNYADYYFPLVSETNFNGATAMPKESTILAGDINIHGGNVSASSFRSQYVWETLLGFNPLIWDFNSVTGKGYPTLRNVVNPEAQ